MVRLHRPEIPAGTLGRLLSGHYYLPICQNTQTSAQTGTGTLRLAPWVVPHAVTLSRIGGEVTTIGDVGSKYRLGVYADDGTCLPGALVLDAGQIAGDSATVQELTIDLTLQPGVYWTGGVTQAVTTTQPTIRVTSTGWDGPFLLPLGSSAPTAGMTASGVLMTGVTGALPSTFTYGASGSSAPRVHVKVA